MPNFIFQFILAPKTSCALQNNWDKYTNHLHIIGPSFTIIVRIDFDYYIH